MNSQLIPTSRSASVFWIASALLAISVLGVAAWLEPSPLGHGTHTQLGLPPCGMLTWAGIPCPGCGLTTSFTHMIRGNVIAASRANPTGVVLFVVTVFSIPVGLVYAVRKTPVISGLEQLRVHLWGIAIAVIAAIWWVYQICLKLP